MGIGVAISWLVGKIFADNLLKFIAIKAIAVTLVVVILPIILNNFMWDIVDMILTLVSDKLETVSMGPQIISVTGLGAYFLDTMKIPQSLSVIISAVGVRAALNAIPFVNV